MKFESEKLERRELHALIGDLIAPLPIGFISTIGQDGGYNAAPFSFIAPVSSKPPIICVSIGLRKGERKDTIKNIEFSCDFVINVVDEAIVKQVIQASADYPSDVDEIKEVGLTAVAGERVKSPRIAESKANLECRLIQKIDLPEQLVKGHGLRSIIFGEVVLFHVKDEVLSDGKVDPTRLGVIGRVAADTYCRTGDIFVMKHSQP